MKAQSQKLLTTRLRAARTLLREWRNAVHDSHKCREEGPNYGKVDDAVANELARFDSAYQALTEAIQIAEERRYG